MSRGKLQYGLVPTEPKILDGCSEGLHHLLLTWFNMGDPFEQVTNETLAESPMVVTAEDHSFVMYLSGVVVGLGGGPRVAWRAELADEINQFLRHLEEHKLLLVKGGDR